MSFKDKKPEFFRMGSGDNLVYSVAEVDEYLAIVEPMAENWEKYEGLGFLPVELFTKLIRFFDELRGYAAENTQMQIKAEGFYNKLIVIENPLKMYEKLDAIKKFVEGRDHHHRWQVNRGREVRESMKIMKEELDPIIKLLEAS